MLRTKTSHFEKKEGTPGEQPISFHQSSNASLRQARKNNRESQGEAVGPPDTEYSESLVEMPGIKTLRNLQTMKSLQQNQ